MVQTALANFFYASAGNKVQNPVLVIGCMHGDEPQGKYLIERYIEKYSETNLIFITCVNPDGVAANTRVNANGVDINRNFPTKNWKLTEKNEYYGGTAPASEVETRFVMEIVEKYEPRLILTLHSPYKVVNFDGNALDVSKKISAIIGYPVVESIGYPTPGSFGTWAGIEKGIPTVTLELDDSVEVKSLEKPVFQIFKMLEEYNSTEMNIL